LSKEDTKQSEKPVNTGPGYFEIILITLGISVATILGYDRRFAQKIRVLDLQGYLRTQKALLTAGEITEQQWTIKLDTVEQILNDEASNHRNHVIVLKDVVLRNGNEIDIR
jgi:hypothetical protein